MRKFLTALVAVVAIGAAAVSTSSTANAWGNGWGVPMDTAGAEVGAGALVRLSPEPLRRIVRRGGGLALLLRWLR